MATRKSSDSQPSIPLELRVPLDEAQNKLEVRIKLGQELKARNVQSESDLDVVKEEWFSWDDYNRRLLKSLVTTEELANEYIGAWVGLIGPKSLVQKIKELKDGVGGAVRRLESIKNQLELIPVAQEATSNNKSTFQPVEISSKVFVVHGHSSGIKETVARLLHKLDLEPVILHEQPNAGRTIIEKFETYADVGYAVVLLTDDDIGYPKNEPNAAKPRARQNVIFELGYFIGKLGRERVCALYTGDVELPSDFQGVLFVPLDEQEAWQLKLAREMKAANLPVDMNKLA